MRDNKLDVLKCIGLAMIVMAHVGPPAWLFQLRNFDVPLMVLISGFAFGLSYKSEPYSIYVWKRVKRLLLPVWVFLTVYFGLILILDRSSLPSNEKILGSYFLLKGIGYVWVVRVFLLVALTAPLVAKFSKICKSHLEYFSILAIVFLVYELLIIFTAVEDSHNVLLADVALYAVPYAVIFALGYRFLNLSHFQIQIAAAFFLFVFIFLCLFLYIQNREIVHTQPFKYPPQFYYFSYALAVSCILWVFIDAIIPVFNKLKIYPLIDFVAKNSLWIYLWHIPFVELIQLPFYSKYPVVLMLSVLMGCLQFHFIDKICAPKIYNPKIRKNLYAIFTG